MKENPTLSKKTAAGALASGSITAILGAAFLLATSSIGPGFLNNTVSYTKQFMGGLGIIIVICVLLDIVVHQNIWRIVCYKGRRGQDIANELKPGLGYVIVVLMSVAGFISNVGNVGGVSLAIRVFADIDVTTATLLGGFLALIVYLFKNVKAAMDKLTIFLGGLMILLCFFVMIKCAPPVSRLVTDVRDLDWGTTITPIIALLGGTAGSYLSLAGPHRLIDAGITGPDNQTLVKKSSLLGCGVGAAMRVLVFLCALGALSIAGDAYDPATPAASVFAAGAGKMGHLLFGVVLFAAAITSVVGCAYTCVSVLKSLHPVVEKHEKVFLLAWIIFPTLIMALVGQPAAMMILVGVFGGMIMPVVLAIILLAGTNKRVMGTEYKHSKVLLVLGWIVVIVMGFSAIRSIPNLLTIFQ